ncbi:hypothetical protein SK128_008198 [Halocaridina rubra]|uniref:Serine racemase n=1 Tax=Halocaridina rubra TaxID=373956 RepID=A0AAN9A4V4_HALRR
MKRKVLPLNLESVQSAQRRIRGWTHVTPVFTCYTVNKLARREIFFKAENLQKTGAFKARGACNAVFLEKEQHPHNAGVVTHSSGNHAQAVAYAAQCAGLDCSVVIPHDAPKVKCEAIRDYGAELIFCEPSPSSRIETCEKVARETGKTIIRSSDNYNVIAGQGTIALEFLEQVPDLDVLLVPVSGGGMLAGVSLTTKALQPGCRVFAVEPVGKNLQTSLEARKRLWSDPPVYLHTIADSLRLQASQRQTIRRKRVGFPD